MNITMMPVAGDPGVLEPREDGWLTGVKRPSTCENSQEYSDGLSRLTYSTLRGFLRNQLVITARSSVRSRHIYLQLSLILLQDYLLHGRKQPVLQVITAEETRRDGVSQWMHSLSHHRPTSGHK